MEDFGINRKLEFQERVCQNCDFSYKGFFSPNCGQRFVQGRFTIGESIGWIFDNIFNLEKGFFFTIKELTVNTSEMLTKYFKRATVAYMHPFRFAFLMATISALVTILSGAFDSSFIMEFIVGWNNYEPANEPSSAEIETGIEVLETVKKYFAFILLVNIPFYAFASFLIYFRRKLNFTEHLILNCYALGFSLLVGLPLFFLTLANYGLEYYSLSNTIVTILSYAFIYHKFFKENYFSSLFKVVLQYLVVIIIIAALAVIGAMFNRLFLG
ncbi:MAG: hypothetical protein ACJASF_001625 [Vicingaceae bacterium]|jgi:hypothetical protein